MQLHNALLTVVWAHARVCGCAVRKYNIIIIMFLTQCASSTTKLEKLPNFHGKRQTEASLSIHC